ncbi:hypothetical protein ACQ858_08345 [Variovorax ureilyticus]|uniref:hypothetical protein n=1 Tax=Variovorax ureilyticus TaxID=1836198 RepID=UPI003D679D18
MKWSKGVIARLVARQTLASKCLLLVDRCNWTGNECDVLGVTQDLRIIDIEVKISRSDLKADAKKDKWWHRLSYAEAQERGVDLWNHRDPVQHPRRVWKHYYAMPAEIWKPELAACLPSTASGILLARETRGGTLAVHCERRATPAKDAYRLKPEQVIDIARLANLRMWDAFKALESAEVTS